MNSVQQRKGVFLLTEGHHKFDNICLKRDVCEVWRGVRWGRQGELVYSGFHTFFQILSHEKFSCHYSLGVCSMAVFSFILTLCFVISLLCRLFPCELECMCEPG